MENWQTKFQFIAHNRIAWFFGLGLVLFLSSIFLASKFDQRQQSVSAQSVPIIPSTQALTVAVDIGGAVVKPGVYHLPQDSLMEDAIAIAGGFDETTADRDFIAKDLNLAAKITDGEKIYVLHKGEDNNTIPNAVLAANTASEAKININTASLEQLETISGISATTANKIITNRPYKIVGDLLTKKAVSKTVYNKIVDKVSVN